MAKRINKTMMDLSNNKEPVSKGQIVKVVLVSLRRKGIGSLKN